MTLEEEAEEILRNALAAYRRHDIDLWQYLEVIRIPLMDKYLERMKE